MAREEGRGTCPDSLVSEIIVRRADRAELQEWELDLPLS